MPYVPYVRRTKKPTDYANVESANAKIEQSCTIDLCILNRNVSRFLGGEVCVRSGVESFMQKRKRRLQV